MLARHHSPLGIFFIASVALSQVRGEQVLEGWCQLEAKLQAFWMALLSQARMTAGFQSSESRNKSRSVSAKALEAAGGLHVCTCRTARLVITLSHAGRGEMPAKYATAPHCRRTPPPHTPPLSLPPKLVEAPPGLEITVTDLQLAWAREKNLWSHNRDTVRIMELECT